MGQFFKCCDRAEGHPSNFRRMTLDSEEYSMLKPENSISLRQTSVCLGEMDVHNPVYQALHGLGFLHLLELFAQGWAFDDLGFEQLLGQGFEQIAVLLENV